MGDPGGRGPLGRRRLPRGRAARGRGRRLGEAEVQPPADLVDLDEPDPHGDGFHVDQLIEDVRVHELTVVADENQSRLIGFEPAYHFATRECLRP